MVWKCGVTAWLWLELQQSQVACVVWCQMVPWWRGSAASSPPRPSEHFCQFTVIQPPPPFVRQPATNMLLFADLWIIHLEQNATTHFWSKSHYRGGGGCVFLSSEDKSFAPQHDLLTGLIKSQKRKSTGNIAMVELKGAPEAEWKIITTHSFLTSARSTTTKTRKDACFVWKLRLWRLLSP